MRQELGETRLPVLWLLWRVLAGLQASERANGFFRGSDEEGRQWLSCAGSGPETGS